MYWGKRNLRLGKNELGVSSKEVKTRSKRMEQTIKGTLRGSYWPQSTGMIFMENL
jgi:hypothetical protein